MDKRGISAIVATVLTILITVAAITIIWVAIVPMISEGIAFDELSGRVSIVAQGGYTVYDAEEEIMIVQVKRDVDDGAMNRIKILFSIEGNSISSNVVAPESGQTKTYTFDLSGYGEPESVSVAPIFVSGSGKEKEGGVQSKVDVPKNRISDAPVASYDLGGDYFYEMPVTGLVSWWKFNDASYVGKDSVGGNDGGEQGDVSIVDGVLVLDGDGDYVDAGDMTETEGIGAITLSAWVYPTDDVQRYILGKNGPYYMRMNDGGTVQCGIFAGATPVWNVPNSNLDATLILNEWNHIVCTYDDPVMNIYIQGSSARSPYTHTVGGVLIETTNTFKIGYFTSGNYFKEKIDNVMIYSKALTPEEITAIYENQRGGKA